MNGKLINICRCWLDNPQNRPKFRELLEELTELYKLAGDELIEREETSSVQEEENDVYNYSENKENDSGYTE